MGVRREGWLDRTGLNLIRGVIGSYFCAVALGVPSGFDTTLLADRLWPGALGQKVVSGLLLAVSLTFIFGVLLRATSLILSGFVITSVTTEMILGQAGSAAWQSIAFGAAILLCYGPLKPHEIHKAALFNSVSLRVGAARVLQKDVTPRRIRPQGPRGKTQTRDPGLRNLGPLIAPTDRMIGLRNGQAPKERSRPGPVPEVEEDPDNIFANL